jgi:hypothetical protein
LRVKEGPLMVPALVALALLELLLVVLVMSLKGIWE